MKLIFSDQAGKPVAGAVTAITAAPADMTDIGYVTDDDGAIVLGIAVPGRYAFTLTGPDGSVLAAQAQLDAEREVNVTANAAG